VDKNDKITSLRLFLSPPAGSSYTSTKKTQNKDYNSESGFGTMVGITSDWYMDLER
jgi:hypothetical protein